jgi:hypothetical protein
MVGTFLAALPEGSPVTGGLAAGKRGIDDLKGRPGIILVEDFDGGTWRTVPARSESGPDVSTVTTDAAEDFAPLQGAALRVRLLKGQTQGLNVHLRLAVNGGGEPEEAYFRYYLRLGSSWDPDLDGGKMPGFAGTYGRAGWGNRKSDGRNGWSTRGAFFKYTDDGSPLSKLRGLGSYVYHAEMSGIDGESWGWNLAPTGLLQKGRWYCIEQHVRLNRPGSGDGVLRAWVDGRLVFERRDLRYREVPDLKIESVWLNVYHGGSQASPRDMTLFIDNLVVAREYIGPSLPAR